MTVGASRVSGLTRDRLLVLISALSVAFILFPPLEAIENQVLTVKMIEGMLLVFYAAMAGYAIRRTAAAWAIRRESGPASAIVALVTGSNGKTKGLIFTLVIPAAVLTYWNFPAVLNFTTANVLARYFADLSFLGVGLMIGLAVRAVPGSIRAILLLFAFLTLGSMGSTMLVWQPGFYSSYSPLQNLVFNTFMMLFGAVGVIATSAWTMKVLGVL